MTINETKNIIDKLYKGIDGFEISRNALSKMNHYYVGYEYGEATTESFYRILASVDPKKTDIFYDLGCGVGKKVFISSIGFGLRKSVGIELIPDLFQTAQNIKKDYENLVSIKNLKLKRNIFEFHQADFNEFDFTDSTIIYLSLAPMAMEIELDGKIRLALDCLKPGSRLITSNTPYYSDKYAIQMSEEYEYKDGKGTVYFHVKSR